MLSRQEHLRITKKRGQYFTPADVVADILEFLKPFRDVSAVDPACGGGVILEQLIQHGIGLVHGFDVDYEMVLTAQKRVGDKAVVAQRDVLVEGLPQKYDVCVANPPFSPNRPDTAAAFVTRSAHPAAQFIELCIAHLTDRGRLAIIVDRGLVTTASHRATRRQLTQMAHLEKIMELPDSAFRDDAGTDFSTFVLFFRRDCAGPTVFVSKTKEWTDSPEYQELLSAGDWLPRSCHRTHCGVSTLGDFVDLIVEPFRNENACSPQVHPETRMLVDRTRVPNRVRRCVRGCLFMSRFAPGNSPSRCAPITEEFHGAGTTAEYYVMRPKDERDLPWLWYQLNFGDDVPAYLNERARGLAHKRVLPPEFLALPMARPADERVRQATQCLAQAQALAEQRKSFLQCVMELSAGDVDGSVPLSA